MNEVYSESIEVQAGIRGVIESQFERVQKYVSRQLIIYVLFYFIPFISQLFADDEDTALIRICNILCLTTQIMLLFNEMIQIKY